VDNFTVNIDGEQVDVTTFDSAKWEEIVASKKDLTISVSGKYQAADDKSIVMIIDELIAGDPIAFVVTNTLAAVGQLQTIAGNVLVADANISADDGNPVTWTATLQNTGTPTFTNRTV
jgi:predicted secreted protein